MQLQGQMISEAAGGEKKVLSLLLLLLMLNCPAMELLMSGWALLLNCIPCVGIDGPVAGIGVVVGFVVFEAVSATAANNRVPSSSRAQRPRQSPRGFIRVDDKAIAAPATCMQVC